MISELPRRGSAPRILTRLGLVLAGFVAAGALAAIVAFAAWLWRHA